MIRLVTQFDSPSARPAAATPTCCGGCCSCCCCCIVTAAVVSIYSASSAQRILRESRDEAPARARWPSPWPGLLAFFALPIVLFLLVLANDPGALLVLPIFWFGMLGLAYWGAGALHPWGRASAVVGIGLVALVVEFFVWLATVDPAIE